MRSLRYSSDPVIERLDRRFDAFEEHIFASLDRFERNILKALEAQERMTVLAIVGTSLSAGLILAAALY